MMEEERLPPGFRFHPTDEELITHYLRRKITEPSFSARAIAEADLNKCEPWDLPGKAKMGEKEWYFFSLRDRKYPTGVRTNRATDAGYWKTTGKDREIFNGNGTELVGMKKTLVFYKGRAPRGEKSDWVMHEYRLHAKSTFKGNKDEWVVCRVFMKTSGKKYLPSNQQRSNHHHLYSTTSTSASIVHSLPPNDPSHFVGGGRHLLSSTTAEITELSKFVGANHLPHLNYPGGFTQPGLKLDLRAPPAPVPQPALLAGMQTPSLQPQESTAGYHQQTNLGLSNFIMGIDGGSNAGVQSTTTSADRCQIIDTLDLESYWPSY